LPIASGQSTQSHLAPLTSIDLPPYSQGPEPLSQGPTSCPPKFPSPIPISQAHSTNSPTSQCPTL
jgi:hypothetical protein